MTNESINLDNDEGNAHSHSTSSSNNQKDSLKAKENQNLWTFNTVKSAIPLLMNEANHNSDEKVLTSSEKISTDQSDDMPKLDKDDFGTVTATSKLNLSKENIFPDQFVSKSQDQYQEKKTPRINSVPPYIPPPNLSATLQRNLMKDVNDGTMKHDSSFSKILKLENFQTSDQLYHLKSEGHLRHFSILEDLTLPRPQTTKAVSLSEKAMATPNYKSGIFLYNFI